ncbi:MAG TPA: fused MFS/spermidine synthase, partial [Polyangiaceae bacterium]|nr:fused MFS/spermidine synthase [Polyangiaceae bacterium]
FSVEPLFAKLVLPTLGGAPAVWSVALVFFQAALLGGYIYAHLLTRHLSLPLAVAVHLCVLCAATLALPIGIASGFATPPAANAEYWLIGLFAASIGLPFVALSANAPLLQAWFSRTSHADAKDPYFLYAASNVGSFLALLSYPLLIEPFARLSQQVHGWSFGFYLLIGLIAVCGVLLLQSPLEGRVRAAEKLAPAPAPGAREALTYCALAAVPSASLVAVTAHISTDVAAAPLLWVLPLALYLLSFVLAFQSERRLSHAACLRAQPYLIAFAVLSIVFSGMQNIVLGVGVHLAAFFVTGLVCHGELARRRPPVEQLTAFYLWVACGGALGGVLAGLVAPNVFNWLAEYPILLVLAVACRPGLYWPGRSRARVGLVAGVLTVLVAALLVRHFGVASVPVFKALITLPLVLAVVEWRREPLKLALAFAGVLLLHYSNLMASGHVRTVRSFFGVHKIYEPVLGNVRIRALMHGTTLHGVQRIDALALTSEGKPATLSYYGPDSPMARSFRAVQKNLGRPVHVAVVGLGAGTMACFTRPEDTLDFYEIDAVVAEIARDARSFEFLARCKPESRVIVGDARLTIQNAPNAFYDLIVMDAFSSDAVPVHLLTTEAMGSYLEKLAPHGLMALHVMNRYMDLVPVVAGVAASQGLITRVQHSGRVPADSALFVSHAAVLARSESDYGALLELGSWRLEAPSPEQPLWTDDYSNIVDPLLRQLRRSWR